MGLSSRNMARGDRNPAVARRHVRSQILATQPCWPVQTEVTFSQYFQLGCGGQLGSQPRVHTDHLRVFHNPGQRRQQLGMIIGYRLSKPLEVAGRHTIRPEGRFTLVATSPATGPLGLRRCWHQVQRSRHRQIVVPTNSGCPWMGSHQLQHAVDCTPGIGPAVNQVTKKDHPAISKIFPPRQPIHQPVQQIDLPVHVADQDHRTIDPGGKPLSLGDGTVSWSRHLLASASCGRNRNGSVPRIRDTPFDGYLLGTAAAWQDRFADPAGGVTVDAARSAGPLWGHPRSASGSQAHPRSSTTCAPTVPRALRRVSARSTRHSRHGWCATYRC